MLSSSALAQSCFSSPLLDLQKYGGGFLAFILSFSYAFLDPIVHQSVSMMDQDRSSEQNPAKKDYTPAPIFIYEYAS